MMYITCNGVGIPISVYTTIHYNDKEIQDVTSVIAEGRELEKCESMIRNKRSDKRSVRYFGDDAKYIVANW